MLHTSYIGNLAKRLICDLSSTVTHEETDVSGPPGRCLGRAIPVPIEEGVFS